MFTYDFDYTKVPDIKVGDDKRYHPTATVVHGSSGTVTKNTLTVDVRVVGQERVVLGGCALDTFVIESATTGAGIPKGIWHTSFSPALRTPIHLKGNFEGLSPVEVSYDRIEQLKK